MNFGPSFFLGAVVPRSGALARTVAGSLAAILMLVACAPVNHSVVESEDSFAAASQRERGDAVGARNVRWSARESDGEYRLTAAGEGVVVQEIVVRVEESGKVTVSLPNASHAATEQEGLELLTEALEGVRGDLEASLELDGIRDPEAFLDAKIEELFGGAARADAAADNEFPEPTQALSPEAAARACKTFKAKQIAIIAVAIGVGVALAVPTGGASLAVASQGVQIAAAVGAVASVGAVSVIRKQSTCGSHVSPGSVVPRLTL